MHDWLVLPDHECVFVRGKAKNRLFGAKRLSFKVAALRVMFNVSERLCLSGFCTVLLSAAANSGVPDRVFQRHGRWKSASAKDGYVKDSTDVKLSLSRSLGLSLFLDFPLHFIKPISLSSRAFMPATGARPKQPK